MSIIGNIKTARERGATDEQIVSQLLRANPSKAQTFAEARSRGASASDIVGQVFGNKTNQAKHLQERGMDNASIINLLSEETRDLSLFDAIGEGIRTGAGKNVGKETFGDNFAGKTVDTVLGVGRGFLKDTTETASGIARITGLQSKEDFEANQKDLTPDGGAEKVGDLLSMVAQFAIPGGAIVKGSNLATKAISGSSRLSKVGRLGLKGGVQGAGFGAVDALRTGGITDEAKTTAVISGAFPFAGVVLSKVKPSKLLSWTKDQVSKKVVGKEAFNIAKEAQGNTLFKDAVQNKITSSSIADGLVKRFEQLSGKGIHQMKVARNKFLSDEALIPTNTAVRVSHDAVRKALGLADGAKITREALVKRALSKQEANKVMSVLEDISTKAGKPLEKISSRRMDEIIKKLDELKAFDKTDDGSKVISAIRGSLNSQLPAKFQGAKKVSSKGIQKLEDDVRSILGLNKDKVLRDQLNNPDQVADKVNQLVKAFSDPNRKANTLKKLTEFDKLNGTQFAKQVEALHLATQYNKVLGKAPAIIETLGANNPLGAGVVTAGLSGAGTGFDGTDATLGVTVGLLVASLKNPKARQQALNWLTKQTPEIRKSVIDKVPELRKVLEDVGLIYKP